MVGISIGVMGRIGAAGSNGCMWSKAVRESEEMFEYVDVGRGQSTDSYGCC